MGRGAERRTEGAEMELWRLPQDGYVDAVRWLPAVTPSQSPLLALGLWNCDKRKTVLDVASLYQDSSDTWPTQVLHHSFPIPGRISALKTSLLSTNHSVLVAASLAGDISVVRVVDPASTATSDAPGAVVCPSLHKGPVNDLDIEASTKDCVSVGKDGKINVLKLEGPSQLQSKCVYDNGGLMSFSAVSWASPVEYVTASFGSVLQWWDQRRPGGPVSRSPAKWANGVSGINCIDVHPSRKHICAVGGSAGSIFTWDLRRQQEPVALAGPLTSRGRQLSTGAIFESEIWEVQFDILLQSAGHGVESGKVPPLMICSEDGILAVLDNGEAIEMTAETTAINTFDIDRENVNNVICGLENESILYLRRPS